MSYPYRVLIVEDNNDEAGQIKSGLLEKIGTSVKVDIAGDTCTAQDLWIKQRYHLASCDMQMPRNSGETTKIPTGVSFVKSIFPAPTLFRLFTAYGINELESEQIIGRETAQIHKLAGITNAEVYLKGMHNPGKNQYNPTTWGHQLAAWLLDKDLPNALLESSGGALPTPLARTAPRLVALWSEAGTNALFWSLWRDFYNMTTLLSWAQLLALVKHHAIDTYLDFDISNEDTRLARMREVVEVLRDHKVNLRNWSTCWLEPRDSRVDANSSLGDGLFATLHSWRQWRNRHAHDFNRANMLDQLSKKRDDMLRLIDLSSFWCKCPLVHSYKFVNSEGLAELSFWSGAQPGIDKKHITLQHADAAVDGCVYLLWLNDRLQRELINLSPWLRVELDQKDNSERLFAFSQRLRVGASGKLVHRYISLDTGQAKDFPPDPEIEAMSIN